MGVKSCHSCIRHLSVSALFTQSKSQSPNADPQHCMQCTDLHSHLTALFLACSTPAIVALLLFPELVKHLCLRSLHFSIPRILFIQVSAQELSNKQGLP